MTVNSINTYITPTVANEVTKPSQPAFLAFAQADADVTGNGTQYTLGTNTAFTQIYDQNADFNTNGTFTAPVTGRYKFIHYVSVDSANGANQSFIRIITSNRQYTGPEFDANAVENTAGGCGFCTSALTDMDAADTAVVVIDYLGAGADDVDIRTTSYFCGYLTV